MKIEELLGSLVKANGLEKQAVPFVKKAVEEIGEIILKYVDEASEENLTLGLIVSMALSQQVYFNALKSNLQSAQLPLNMLRGKEGKLDPKTVEILEKAMKKTLAAKTSKIVSRTANLCKTALEDGFEMFDADDMGDI